MMDYTDMTEVTDQETLRLGRYVLNAITVAAALGHVSPIGTVRDYVTRDVDNDDPMYHLVLDIFRACDRGPDEDVEAARARIIEFVDNSGQLDYIAAAALL